MRGRTALILFVPAIILSGAPASAGVVFPGASERERTEATREEMLKFYRRFAPKALEMEAWSRGLEGGEAERMVMRALRFNRDGSVPAGNIFHRRRGSTCVETHVRTCGKGEGNTGLRTLSSLRGAKPAAASRPGPRPVLVVDVPGGTPVRDVGPILEDALAEGRRKGLDVVLRVEVAGPGEVAKWSRVAPEDVSLELVRASAGSGSDAGATPRVETEYRR